MNTRNPSGRFINLLVIFMLLCGSLQAAQTTASARPAYTPDPTSVTLAGSLQSELGCATDWDPACAASHFTYDATDDVWQASFLLPAGSYEYKAALNDAWTESYGLNTGGSNIPLNLAADATVKFYYDHKTHWITSNVNSAIATAAGSFQSELGCPGDWAPDCLRSWLEDPTGSGTYSFSTTAIPVGSYEAKVAMDEGWAVSYGVGGGGTNIPFTVAVPLSTVTFSFDPVSHVPTVTVKSPGPQLDNIVEWDGLRHDSRDLLYRTPGGAVSTGTPVTLRMRTFHNDVNKVQVRLYDVNTSAQHIENMSLAASDVSCYQADLAASTCDFWAYTLPNASSDNLWYRFLITDGTKTVYYGDNTAALDGGLGSPSDTAIDNSFALMVYDPAFTAPAWAKDAVIYQIFPDRFRNGSAANDPVTGDLRYNDPVLKLPWGTLPEGFCVNYADASANCPWRFDPNPPPTSPTKESPRGRDYMGGDLQGVDQKLDYLVSLGVNTIYFNPIFDSGSNHGYDTQDYTKIDPYFGTQADWNQLVTDANAKNVRIVLDGVFNHMSSDSPFFDRYHHYATVGACESAASPYRAWFHFRAPTGSETAVCAPSTPGGSDTQYDGWFGFDSIPVLTKSNAEVQAYFLTNADSISKLWLNQGASAWRLDVMGDASFPAGYWESFRSVVKTTKPDALIISETWQKDSTLLRFLRGDRADTTMNYRLRDAVIGFLAPGAFDSKGFADSGRILAPSEFAARLASVREDYPDAAFYSLMNLVDSHDTERVLWTLTPGTATTADKELNSANLAVGKNSQKLASFIQFTLPGAPTIYYGDEVGINGGGDPDTRRTYPWADLGGSPDTVMFTHYQTLATLRKNNAALVSGDLRMLLADDAAGTVAYGRKTSAQAALVLINRSALTHIVNIPLAGYIPDGVNFTSLYAVGNSSPVNTTVSAGSISVSLEPNSAYLLASGAAIDLLPPAAPTALSVTNEGDAQLSLGWTASAGASGYNLYRSPLSGGGWVKVNSAPIAGLTYDDAPLLNAHNYFYVVTALDADGNESAYSNEASGMPHLSIGWADLQWPPTLAHTISVTNRTANTYGQVWISGVTSLSGATPGLTAQLGFGPSGSNPNGNAAWIWVDAAFDSDQGSNDQFVATLLPETTGTFDYLYRYSTTNGRDWLYADLSGTITAGNLPSNPGVLTVSPSTDTTAPATPLNLHVTLVSPLNIDLAWDAVSGDASLYGYEVLRSATAGGPYTMIARLTGTTYSDTSVVEGGSYYYVVRALDTSFNYSGNSNEVHAIALPRTVTLTFNVTVPATTAPTGRSVYIAGFLDRLDGGFPQWNPGGAKLTQVDATHWSITFTGKENTQIEYKYALGSWDFVEKDAACGEIGNRLLTLSYGASGVQTVNDTVQTWWNVSPCSAATFTVSGSLGANGAGATITYTGGNTTAAALTGNYSFVVPYGWSGTIAAAKNACTKYTFSAPITVNTLTADLPNQDFVTTPHIAADFNGDGKSDLALFRKSTGEWRVMYSGTTTTSIKQWGNLANRDVPVPGDYDGDGKTDWAVYRPTNGTWYITYAAGGTKTQQWGNVANGDTPQPGDYDGDGKADFAVFRPTTGTWFIKFANGSPDYSQQWGNVPNGDRPTPGDFNCDGRTELAVWRPTNGTWYVRYYDGTSTSKAMGNIPGGQPLPVGDYNGDGLADYVALRPSDNTWYVFYSGGLPTLTQWGNIPSGDFIVPGGDYNGDGTTDFAAWRPTNNFWYVLYFDATRYTQQWGIAGDNPLLKR